MRGNLQRLQQAAVTPAQGTSASVGGVRVSQGRARARNTFGGLQGILNGVAALTNKAAQDTAEAEAAAFYATRKGEAPEARDTRVDEEIAKLLNRNKLLSEAGTPQFHATLAKLRGGRIVDLVSREVEARESELLSLNTLEGIDDQGIPTVNDLTNEVIGKYQEKFPELFSDTLTGATISKGLDIFQSDYGNRIAARQSEIRVDIAEELYRNESTQRLFENDLEDVKHLGKVFGAITTELGRHGVSPRRAREVTIEGIIEGMDQISDSKAEGFGPAVAARLARELSDKETGIPLGGRRIGLDSKTASAFRSAEDRYLSQEEDDNRKIVSELTRRGTEIEQSAKLAVAGLKADLLSAGRKGADITDLVTNTLLSQLETDIQDPEIRSRATELLFDAATTLEGKFRAEKLDPDLERTVRRGLLSKNPVEFQLALDAFLAPENSKAFSGSAEQEFSRFSGEVDKGLKTLKELPAFGSLEKSTTVASSAAAGLPASLAANIRFDISEKQLDLQSEALDLVTSGDVAGASKLLKDGAKEIVEFGKSQASGAKERSKLFTVGILDKIQTLQLTSDEVNQAVVDDIITPEQGSQYLKQIGESNRVSVGYVDNITNSIVSQFDALMQGGEFDSRLVQARPDLSGILGDPKDREEFIRSFHKELRSDAKRTYLEELKNTGSPAVAFKKAKDTMNDKSIGGLLSPGDLDKIKSVSKAEKASGRKRTEDEYQANRLSSPSMIAQAEFTSIPNAAKSLQLIAARKVVSSFSDKHQKGASLTHAKNAMGAAILQLAKGSDEQKAVVRSTMMTTGIPESVLLGGDVFQAETVDIDALIKARNESPEVARQKRLYARYRKTLNTVGYFSARDAARKAGMIVFSRDGIEKYEKSLSRAVQAPWVVENFSKYSVHMFGDLSGSRNIERLFLDTGLTPSNPKFTKNTPVPLDVNSIPFFSAGMDLRIKPKDMKGLGLGIKDFYEREFTIHIDGEVLDQKDPVDALKIYQKTKPKKWRKIMENAGVNLDSPVDIKTFEAIVRDNTAKTFAKGDN